MTWIDYAVLAIIVVSVLLSVFHGLVRELMALAAWVAAFFVAQAYAPAVETIVPVAISNPALRMLAAFVAVFLGVLVAMTLLGAGISSLLRSVGLGTVDRILGAVFGLVRGLAIVLIAVLLAGLTALPRQPAWRHATFTAPLEALANAVKVWLPYGFSKHVNYD